MFPARVYVGQIIAVFAIVLAAIWGATQWTAAALGYHAALGPAWFTVVDFPVIGRGSCSNGGTFTTPMRRMCLSRRAQSRRAAALQARYSQS